MLAIAVGLASAQLEGDEGEARVLPPGTCEARNPAGFSGAAADVIYDRSSVVYWSSKRRGFSETCSIHNRAGTAA